MRLATELTASSFDVTSGDPGNDAAFGRAGTDLVARHLPPPDGHGNRSAAVWWVEWQAAMPPGSPSATLVNRPSGGRTVTWPAGASGA
jgi:hypothetical protein